MACSAAWRVLTCGTTMPMVPRSSARMIIPGSLVLTRVTEVIPHRQITGARHVTDLLPTERSMLALEPDPVEAKLSQEVNHVGIGMARYYSDRLPLPQLPLDPILAHPGSPLGSRPSARGWR